MTEHEFTLFDRCEKIKQIVGQYGESKFALSFSGGKDSTALSWLLDKAIPGNSIPRVFCDTGIEYESIRAFVKETQSKDPRVVIIKPEANIKETLEQHGYPFKNKEHSLMVYYYQRDGMGQMVHDYVYNTEKWKRHGCPKALQYQFHEPMPFRISDRCCKVLKEVPLDKWQKENGKPYSITGIMRDEGGRRRGALCLFFRKNKLRSFRPLATVGKEFIEWLIRENGIPVCELYKPPFSFRRTGCKGCPFSLQLKQQLEVMERLLPTERKQCEYIWKPVYDEYRRIHYRL